MSKMLAAVIHEHGDRDVVRLEQVPIPQPAVGEVRLKVHACALKLAGRGHSQGTPVRRNPLPMTTGVDISGEVDAIGADVSGWLAGDEVTVYSLVTCGDCEFCRGGDLTVLPTASDYRRAYQRGLAEYVIVPARNLIPKPKNLNHIEVAALPVVAGTAWHMLVTVASLQAGETVFIPGAGGGVASLGIQIAKHAGARVIASTSTADKSRKARELGADHVVDYHDENWVEQVIDATKGAALTSCKTTSAARPGPTRCGHWRAMAVWWSVGHTPAGNLS